MTPQQTINNYMSVHNLTTDELWGKYKNLGFGLSTLRSWKQGKYANSTAAKMFAYILQHQL